MPNTKLMRKNLPQNLAASRQDALPVNRCAPSINAIRAIRPSVNGTNRKWYATVNPNWIRERSMASLIPPRYGADSWRLAKSLIRAPNSIRSKLHERKRTSSGDGEHRLARLRSRVRAQAIGSRPPQSNWNRKTHDVTRMLI